MCQWGDEVLIDVPIPADLSHTGEFRWDKKAVDRCIAPIVVALNAAGVFTANCCCGHGKEDAKIILHDGRTIVIYQSLTAAEQIIASDVETAPRG